MSDATSLTVPFARPSISEEEKQAVLEILDSGWLTTGKKALEFENNFSAFMNKIDTTKKRKELSLNTNQVISLAVNSNTSGMILAMEACGVTNNTAVITTPYTFVSTAMCARHLGADVFFADLEKGSYNIDPVKIEEILKNEYNTKEKELYLISVRLGNQNKRILKQESTKRVIDFLMVLPNGIMAMSIDIAGLVETSLNVGILKLEENEMIASSAIRSSIESAKKYIMEQMEVVSSLAGGSISVHGDYPGWQYDPDSKLRATMLQVYEEMFGIKPKVEAIHAGLECGVFASKIKDFDCISIGPNMFDVHTVKERLSVSSTEGTENRVPEMETAVKRAFAIIEKYAAIMIDLETLESNFDNISITSELSTVLSTILMLFLIFLFIFDIFFTANIIKKIIFLYK
mgnify:CR=1 FL=1